ncbi:probable folate-biopterin transporter 9, chloroplastic [Carya illinoinensis]|uniref:Folate-biopterin transporter 9, chloroplastic n=1 Tax=Carya illinoinensis TaxID=32201 RepID=A0A8T1RPB8_CARIL|nr:probable folate-biopterin transporter 9, chloroplastic [Carya illinoinensis]XP_042941779.1 probable folate-biopterin transporter 9, chloroplastic [Carya illinoinensis]KAG6668515.1 hypothetical protein CIPAW_01G176000 [Carya illinoinensis]
MIYPSVSTKKPFATVIPKFHKPPPKLSLSNSMSILCFHRHKPNIINESAKPGTRFRDSITVNPSQFYFKKSVKQRGYEERRGTSSVNSRQMLLLCGFGYWIQGFRCFPWLALNFHMAHYLNMHPSTLQLVQNAGNLPMVAKPLYGLLSDVLYIGGARRVPYVSIGVLLQVLSWGPLSLIPVAGESLPTLMACVLLGNLGASITEVAKDALVAEYGKKHKVNGLQSYAFMASAAGGILGNLIGGYYLLKAPSRTMFIVFAILLSLQFGISVTTREESPGLPQPLNGCLARKSLSGIIRKQFCGLITAVSEKSISRPLAWIVASIAVVPILSGSIFCYQMRCLHIDASVIGMSRVISQLVLLSTTVLYNRYWKKVSMRKLIGAVQILYASSLLLDLVLVKQINLRFGIPNQAFALCFSGLAETLAQFRLLPFSVLLASLCPKGCEGSLTSFVASVLCLSAMISGFLGVGLASLMGITSSDYSSLPMGILVQFLAALIPLGWIHCIPMAEAVAEKEKKRSMSKRTRRNRRVGRMVFGSVYAYRRERKSETQS